MGITILFWVFVFVVFYTYFGYGALIWGVNRARLLFTKSSSYNDTPEFEPVIALIITAYNEQDCIEDKIQNTFALDYPPDKLQVYFITDGSTDDTPLLIKQYPRFTLLHHSDRQGKAAAMNRAVQFVKEPFIVFCDANTQLNPGCIKELMKPFQHPGVGAVAGEKKIHVSSTGTVASMGEGLYWKYESFLKKQDSLLHSVVGAAGELFSVRTELYQPLEEAVIIEDFVLTLRIAMKGYSVKYAPAAYAVETAAASIKDEQQRKIRICAGGFQAMYLLKGLLNIFRYRMLTFQYVSHRVLRWTLAPLFLLLLFPLNLVLALKIPGIIYKLTLVMQLFFYLLGMAGWLYGNKITKFKWLYIPYYFLLMNISVFLGFRRYWTGHQSALWDKTAREKMA